MGKNELVLISEMNARIQIRAKITRRFTDIILHKYLV